MERKKKKERTKHSSIKETIILADNHGFLNLGSVHDKLRGDEKRTGRKLRYCPLLVPAMWRG
jgi:hypothetical protein